MPTARQELILRKVVEVYLESGQPVGSKTLSADPDLDCRPSTIRNELARLEAVGLLAHPHTSAGRVPTDAAVRRFVDGLLAERTQPSHELQLSLTSREVDEAMRATTEALSQVSNLLAIVTAPPIETAEIRHIEVLALQPQVLMVVIITSTGGVSKRIFTFEDPVDPGLASWAAAYLNDQLTGMDLGARTLQRRLADPGLGPREREFLDALMPAFTELAATAQDTLYVDGAARLISEHRFEDLDQINELMTVLERRRDLLAVLRRALSERDVLVRIGAENDAPLQSMALVAAAYGLPARKLGTVSLMGPVRMDYAEAIVMVRDAAHQLSRYIETVYDEA
ncbi:MAG TPA: heat-inducible transcriptional repressor HrcA [Solirubrobacteraceae bacterium]|nr:heat-inducible transcriptional repressor HrcA [Solirubrobacteraceae bacterium]